MILGAVVSVIGGVSPSEYRVPVGNSLPFYGGAEDFYNMTQATCRAMPLSTGKQL